MTRTLRLAPVAVTAALLMAACGGTDTTDTTDAAAPTEAPMASEMASETPMDSESMDSESMDSESMGSESMDAMAGPVGPGCADYVAAVPEGDGSVEGMSQDPVAVAAGNNPLLTTLTAAVSGGVNPDVNLVDTLNGGEFTVFAPTDDAFAADVDQATLDALSTDADLLTTVLTYHVVPGRISPADIAGTTQTTVEGTTLEVAGTPDMLTVNGANVICGGVSTANATVYLIDGVLMPTS